MAVTVNDLPGAPMPGSTGGAPQMIGGCAAIVLTAVQNTDAADAKGPLQPPTGGST